MMYVDGWFVCNCNEAVGSGGVPIVVSVHYVDAGPMKPRTIEMEAISDDLAEAIRRLQAWIRDYGQFSEQQFVADLETVIDAVQVK